MLPGFGSPAMAGEQEEALDARIARLVEDDERFLLMDTFLSMPHDLDRQFCASQSMQEQQIAWDTVGLMIGLLTNVLGIIGYGKGFGALNCKVGATCQFMQLIWLHRHRRSYTKCRYWVMVLQRLRWMAGQAMITKALTAQQLSTSFFKRATSSPGSWRAFVSIVVSSQLPSLVSSICHLLPFKTQLVLATVSLSFDLSAFHFRKVEIMKMAQLDVLVPAACSFIRKALLFPRSAVLEQLPDSCVHGGVSFILVYSNIVLGLLLPLQVTYWHE